MSIFGRRIPLRHFLFGRGFFLCSQYFLLNIFTLSFSAYIQRIFLSLNSVRLDNNVSLRRRWNIRNWRLSWWLFLMLRRFFRCVAFWFNRPLAGYFNFFYIYPILSVDDFEPFIRACWCGWASNFDTFASWCVQAFFFSLNFWRNLKLSNRLLFQLLLLTHLLKHRLNIQTVFLALWYLCFLLLLALS